MGQISVVVDGLGGGGGRGSEEAVAKEAKRQKVSQ